MEARTTEVYRRWRALPLLFGLAVGALLLHACREADGPIGPGGGARVFVSSDPGGARILLDGRSTGRRTPDTIAGLSRRHDVAVRLDTLGVAYGFLAQVQADPDDVQRIHGPLVMRCPNTTCWEAQHRFHTVNRLRFATNPVGSLLMRTGVGEGLFWPLGTRNSYVSAAVPVFAAITEGRDTVALGMYDLRYLAGRPAPSVTNEDARFDLRQSHWLLPPVDALTFRTVRGIEIEQHVMGSDAHDDVLLVRLVFRNITQNAAYSAADPIVPAAGLRFDGVYIGFAIDPDIGSPQSDWVSYNPELDMVFAYSAAFRETDRDRGFEGEARTAPGLVGLRVVAAPPGARVVLNAWTHGAAGMPGDWRAGFASERAGWGMLSGLQAYAPQHADSRIGHLPPAPGDVRISVSAGPLQLRPGDSAEIIVAIVLAAPVPGTFTSGTPLEPGDPRSPDRQIARVAADLFERAATADALLQLLDDQ
jgi:hypothetical protein